MYILKVLSAIGVVFLSINTILYFTGFTRHGKTCKTFFFYLLGILIIQLAMEIYAIYKINNHFLSTYYLFLNFTLLSVFFHQLFGSICHKAVRFIKYITLVVLLGMVVQYIIDPNLYFQFNSTGFLVTTVILIVYSALYLYELLSKKIAYANIISGMLIYYISSSLIFATATALINFDEGTSILIWKVNAVLFIIYQILILREWIQTFYRKTQLGQ